MPSRRDQIKMAAEEVESLLAEEEILIVATLGKDGRPHLTALWYILRDSEPWIFTYAKSQKVRNLERDSRATLLVEAGRSYTEVRGAMLTSEAEIHRDLDTVADVGEELFAKYGGEREGGAWELDQGRKEALRERARKRVAVRFRTLSVASWDHAKLDGTY